MHCYKCGVLTVTGGALGLIVWAAEVRMHCFSGWFFGTHTYLYIFFIIYFDIVLIKKGCVELGLAYGFY